MTATTHLPYIRAIFLVFYGFLSVKIFGAVLMSLGFCSILALVIILLATATAVVSNLKLNTAPYYIGK